jgi:hypothetical protein
MTEEDFVNGVISGDVSLEEILRARRAKRGPEGVSTVLPLRTPYMYFVTEMTSADGQKKRQVVYPAICVRTHDDGSVEDVLMTDYPDMISAPPVHPTLPDYKWELVNPNFVRLIPNLGGVPTGRHVWCQVPVDGEGYIHDFSRPLGLSPQPAFEEIQQPQPLPDGVQLREVPLP